MRKLLVRTLPACALCAALAVVAIDRGWLRLPLAPKVIGDVPVMTDTEAEVHRANRYTQIAGIEDLFALPGHFARMEALYALAGRSDSAAVQDLIYQASGIADPASRRDTLLVLFTRLAELDPKSALALSRTLAFANDPAYEREVWRRWGERDLDAALQHAAGQRPESRRNFAAQALMAAHGYWGNEQTARIAEYLHSEPDNRTRSARLDELAHSDPAAAIAYVHSIDSPLHRRQAAAHLGLLLGRGGLADAERHAVFFNDPMLRGVFEDAAAQAAAEIDPAGTLERLFAEGDAVPASRLVAVFTAVAAQDMGRALAAFDRIQNRRQRLYVGSAIAEQLTRTDPLRALAWAQEIDGGSERGIYRMILGTLAETDPELAMSSARSLDNARQRLSAMAAVARQVSEQDPRRALALLDDIESRQQRDMLLQSIGMNWLQQDPEAALQWMLTAEVGERSRLIAQAGVMLAHRDLDLAMRLLPRLEKEQAAAWRQQIARGIATERSVAEARSFIAQYEGSPEYPQLLSAVIQGVARNDPTQAVRMLDEMPGAAEQWRLYSAVFMQYAEQDPRQAAEAVVSLDNDNLPGTRIVSQVIARWARSDPAAAERWADNLPVGRQRDAAIAGAAMQWTEVTSSRRRMLESIRDPALRQRAITSTVFRVWREDRQAAERLLREINLPPEQKEEVRQRLNGMRGHPGSPSFGVW